MHGPRRRRRARDDSVDEAAVRAANRAFYDAFEARDLDAMSDVWEHDDRVVLHPPRLAHPARLGRRVGVVVRALRRARARCSSSSPNEVVSVAGDAAWVTVDENLISADGGGTVAAVNLFLRDGRAVAAASPTTARRWRPRPDATAAHYPAATVQEAPPTDGRTLRSLRTREAIVDATIGLLEEGDLRPTAPRVAERAKVSVRSVFQHFDDLERLHAAVAERLVERVAVLVAPGAGRPARSTCASTASCTSGRSCSRPSRRSAGRPTSTARSPPRSPPASATARRSCARSWCVTFEPELAAAGADRDDLLDCLDAALSWATWEGLRAGLGPQPARRRAGGAPPGRRRAAAERRLSPSAGRAGARR